MDIVYFENILIQNNTLSPRMQINSILVTHASHQTFVNNITVRNNVGPILRLQGALSQKITNCLFENVSNSQLLNQFSQFIIAIFPLDDIGLDLTKEKSVEIRNVSLNVSKKKFIFIK